MNEELYQHFLRSAACRTLGVEEMRTLVKAALDRRFEARQIDKYFYELLGAFVTLEAILNPNMPSPVGFDREDVQTYYGMEI